MVNKINLHYQVTPVPVKKITEPHKINKDTTVNFKDLLNKEIVDKRLSFSSHCIKRLEQNNINLSNIQIDKLTKAIDKAESKGAKESLMLLDDLALVVSIKNRTVITAVDSERMKDNVFTNIDSAVII
ncbi:flagellar operon protein [Desulfonispora thiosulfatigenes DSM 11270]|uniref:Flagellar operon protein n=1 Tax=Desulfonispora thiosulfatigenes DSM 11270 TaxID=656914 RepID=A0A1W1UMR6_DESTI|nr:TIGR02530 family flagellar biosynthesis protein [Desulfonispora thiosulfatigenes]SMB82425.1 flagellar operon protein [Desulfonispora thiosulfatigenes DSM 11270]